MNGSVTKDAFWQILGRFLSAISGFLVTIMMTKMFGPLRYGDYNTVLSYFALRSALADLGLYVLALKEIGGIKKQYNILDYKTWLSSSAEIKHKVSEAYSQFVVSRTVQILAVYSFALLVAYLIPSYRENIYIARGLPIGMLFSASFLIASIIQLPLQLFWRMHHVTIALTLSRIVQILILVGLVGYTTRQGGGQSISLGVFLLGLCSVLLSGITQVWYTLYQSTKIITLRYVSFWVHLVSRIQHNWQYGIAYFLSSFHMLLGALYISMYYPTTLGYNFTGTWGLSLSLMQVLLVVPSSFANSILHKVSHITLDRQRLSFGKLMLIMIWFGLYCGIVFTVFGSLIITLISSNKYLTHGYLLSRDGLTQLITSTNNILLQPYGSDYILPFLGGVLVLSFIKTVYNYILVANDKQNTLLWINLWGCAIGAPITWYMIMKYQIAGAAISQLVMEAAFVYYSVIYTKKLHLTPFMSFSQLGMILLRSLLCISSGLYIVDYIYTYSIVWQCSIATVFSVLIALPWYSWLRTKLSTLID